jgi:DNA-binding PadR family transcriptional regulator
MQRDMDLVRELLLRIESSPNARGEEITIPGRSAGEVGYHLKLLEEAGFIDGIDVEAWDDDGPSLILLRLTWAGHDFLDSVRDDKIWTDVRGHLRKVGGSAAIEVVKALAVGAAKAALGLT